MSECGRALFLNGDLMTSLFNLKTHVLQTIPREDVKSGGTIILVLELVRVTSARGRQRRQRHTQRKSVLRSAYLHRGKEPATWGWTGSVGNDRFDSILDIHF